MTTRQRYFRPVCHRTAASNSAVLRRVCSTALLVTLCPLLARADEEPWQQSVRAAAARGLEIIEASAAHYIEQRDCFSCHHQALPMLALCEARQMGFQVGEQAARRQAEFTLAYFEPRRRRLEMGEGVPGGPYTAGYALLSLAVEGQAADETTAALMAYLLKTQEPDGHWRIRTHRPPLEDSDFTATALSLQGLRLWGKQAAQDEDAPPPDLDTRLADARRWLEQHEPVTHEDRVFQLLGLAFSDADPGTIDRAARQLLAEQRDEGCWGQLPDLDGDAYATGQALVALHTSAALKVDDPAWRRGIDWLIRAQQEDGSWLVTTRSRPIQVYFESGFPHGKSQFISICGTCWATQALVRAAPLAHSQPPCP